jgi:eukaryotic-like serine/threonine-protein kinase
VRIAPDDVTVDESLLAANEAPDPMLGELLDRRFRVLERLGTGGMATVYRGVQVSLDRPVAIKVIRGDLLEDPAIVQRFVREARLLTSINHPNIVSVYDVGHTASGMLYIVMELVRGATLESELLRGRFAAERAREIAGQLCDALAATHEHGIVHRDLKPANIMLLEAPGLHDIVKVLDFGLATSLATSRPASRLTVAGMVMGTPRYMAPETIGSAGAVADAKSDLYSLGCVLYELLAGRPPFTDSALPVVLARHLRDAPPRLPPDVPLTVARLVMALLAKDPANRPELGEVRAWLRALAEPPPPDAADEMETLVGAPAVRPTLRALPRTPLMRVPTLRLTSPRQPISVPWLLVVALAIVLAGLVVLWAA